MSNMVNLEENKKQLWELYKDKFKFALWMDNMSSFAHEIFINNDCDFAYGNITEDIRIYLYKLERVRDECFEKLTVNVVTAGKGWPGLINQEPKRVDHMAIIREMVGGR